MTESLSPNLEDYLEAIFILESANTSARAKDIAVRLGVQRASVTGALHALSEKGLINYQPYTSVTLTPEGFRLATKIMHRHKVLQEFLQKFLQLPFDVAEANACRMEHHIDDQVLNRIIQFVHFISDCPRTGEDWLQSFKRLCSEAGECAHCVNCIEKCLETQKKR